MTDYLQYGTGPSLANAGTRPAGFTLLRAPQVLTAGTSIDHPEGTRLIRIRGCGGGAGGGGGDAAAGSVGGGGGAAGYLEHTFVAASLSSTYTIGSLGAGVSDANGANGTASTFTHNGSTMTANGGTGGSKEAGGSTAAVATGGGGGTVAGSPNVSVPGQDGARGIRPNAATTPTISGQGGSSPLGCGGASRAVVGVGTGAEDATGYGAGGAGACRGTSTVAAAGGNGTPGIWIVEELG